MMGNFFCLLGRVIAAALLAYVAYWVIKAIRCQAREVSPLPESTFHSGQKIHIVGRPVLKIEGTPVFLDVEGLPDCDSYYLIGGVRIKTVEGTVQHSLWADKAEKNVDSVPIGW
jgi:hypothetical protein